MDEDEKVDARSYWLGIIIALATLPVAILVAHFKGSDAGTSIGILLGMNVFAIGICWDLRRYWWFWLCDAAILIAHLPIVWSVRWPKHWVPAAALLPLGLLDIAVTVGLIRIVARFFPHDLS